ncbi:MAG: hypothetical protein K8I27_00920 [Planctomycetes bacterium]|nr:hypothetical protein [Planctomycetota bacterium]
MLRWTIAGVLGAFFLMLAYGNGWIAFQQIVLRKKAPSWIPLFGGFAGACAVIIAPVDGLWVWAWIPLLIDWGCIPGFVHTAFFWLYLVPKMKRHEQKPPDG